MKAEAIPVSDRPTDIAAYPDGAPVESAATAAQYVAGAAAVHLNTMSAEANVTAGLRRQRLLVAIGHVIFLLVFLGGWEWGARAGVLSPTFFGQPSGIASFLVASAADGKLWSDLGWTLLSTLLSFSLGATLAICTGLAFVRWPSLEHFLEPYFSALNVMPRIALAPLFILWFGLGIGSKIAVGFSLAFFIVLSATVAGVRGVSSDHITLCRTLGARPSQVFFSVTLPGAVPVLFSGLRLGLIYALLGVVAAEIIASDRGLGQSLAYLGSVFSTNGVMALLLVLALLGVAVVRAMTWIEKRLLHWQ